MRLIGIGCVILGVVLLIYGGLTFIVPKDVVDLGVLSITVHENLRIPLPPIAGAVFLVLGIVMVMSVPAGPPP